VTEHSLVTDEDVVDPRGDDEEVGKPIRYRLMSYGSDLPVDALLRRLEDEVLLVPEFQRSFVWSLPQASRFIESLLLGLPVPEVFFFKEPDTRKLLIVDGQQRLLSIQRFYQGRFGKRVFRLRGVGEEFLGKTITSLEPKDRRELDHSILHATIFEQLEPTDDRSSVYSVFERLNTGGSALKAQEIRSTVYRGPLNDLLRELVADPHWRNLYGPPSPRKRDEEIALRFLALAESGHSYQSPMKRYLNDFMERNRSADSETLNRYAKRFTETVQTVDTLLGRDVLRPDGPLNVAIADAVLVATEHRLRRGPVTSRSSLRRAHDKLMRDLREDDLYRDRTTHTNRLRARISHARKRYGEVE